MIEPILSDEALLADITSAGQERDGVHVWWLGQSGYLLMRRGESLLIDPYLSDTLTAKYADTAMPHVRISRRVVDPSRLGFVSAVLSTHGHTDHLDPATLQSVARHAERPPIAVVVAAATEELARTRLGSVPAQVMPVDAGGRVEIGPFVAHAVPARHGEPLVDEQGRHTCLGYVIGVGGVRVYHSGDTLPHPPAIDALRGLGQAVDVALVPINGKLNNLDGQQAAELAAAVGAGLAVPCHYDLFAFNTADPEAMFLPACRRLGQSARVLRLGERLTVVPKELSR